MKSSRGWIIAALALALVATAYAAEQLNVKPGLWEITSDTQMSGMPPLPKEMLERLTPEQRALMEAAIKAQADNGPIHDVSQECVTKEDLDEPFKAEDLENCEQTTLQDSRTHKEIRLVCKGERNGSGVFRVDATTPESMRAELEMQVESGADKMTITAKMTGKWLKADCGDVG